MRPRPVSAAHWLPLPSGRNAHAIDRARFITRERLVFRPSDFLALRTRAAPPRPIFELA